MHVVEDPKETKIDGPNQMTLVLEIPKSEPMESLTSLKTRNEVLTMARMRGFPAKGLNAVPQPYPVDEKGETSEDHILGKKPFVGWRAKYIISSGVL